MRFMVIVKATRESEAGVLPGKELLVAMSRFNEEMSKAGILLAMDGLQPSSKGARIKFSAKGKHIVTDGPFAETKELIAGFWMIEVKSKQEAIEWMLRCPTTSIGGELEIRQVYEAADFPPEVFPEEEVALEQALRDKLAGRSQNK